MQHLDPATDPTTITINQEALVQCTHFKYLGNSLQTTLAQTVNSETGREMTMERLCDFCSTSGLIITGTIFPQQHIFKLTYRSPDGRRVNQIDYILVNGKMRTILDTRVMRGADVYSDH